MDKLGLRRDIDLALHLPLRYEDETRVLAIADSPDGEPVQVEGIVTECRIEQRGRRQLLVRIQDDSGSLLLRFLNFYPSHQKTLAVGARVRVRGEARNGFFGREMVHPHFKAVDAHTPLATALTPVYPSSAQLPQAYLRKAVAAALRRAPLDELLPPGSVPAGLPTLRAALLRLHHPPAGESMAALDDRSHPAWQRLKFEELLSQQLSQQASQQERALLHAPLLRARPQGLPEQLLAALPFQLTAAQRRVADEIAADLCRPRPATAIPDASAADTGAVPMNRLLQGDVGSGKTVVAALAAAIAIDSGWQCALMAPTELLAEQHFRKLVQWLDPLLAPLGGGIAWLTGSRRGKGRARQVAQVASGQAMLVVGTQAVIQDDVHFARLGLAIIDEQHRFGVAQRLALRSKMTPHTEPAPARGRAGEGAVSLHGVNVADLNVNKEREPHLLMMTATPIPRTLAMSYYADLDVSTIDELPPGRTPIVTKLVNESRRDEVVERIRNQLAQGRQVYWVCPLIEESEALDLTNATQTHADLSAALNSAPAPPLHGSLPPDRAGHALGRPGGGAGVMVGLLHSRMPVPEKKAVMSLFTSGHMGVLVSTTVIEVGVDVPNASLMVIEHAERFGLSQLHQLRGRVGRGAAASACVLIYSTGDATRLGEMARERLKAMVQTNDGFEIARRDLEIRGPGEFLGARQSGDALLRFADLATDIDLLAWARAAAPVMLDKYPELAEKHVYRWLGGKAEFLKA